MFEKVIKFWSENTCLNFKQVLQSRCSKKQSTPAIRLYSSSYYKEHFGIDKSEACTRVTLGIGDWESVHKIIMNVLGMMSYTYRNDSAQYISLNEENLEAFQTPFYIVLRDILASYYRCHGKTPVLPTPFDYLSKQLPYSAEFGNTDMLPAYVTREPRHQYLLDYHWAASVDPTFYDVMVINTLYKCPAEWAAACKSAVPKCKNHGYLLKTCRCHCPPGFSGDTCQTKSGRMFPLQPAAYEIKVSSDKTYDFASLNLKTVNIANANRRFNHHIFIIIYIEPKKATHLPSVSLVLPFEEVGKKFGPLIADRMPSDCNGGMRLLWGSGNRLACDCLSSLVTNEPPDEVRVFRGRRPKMGLTLINNVGLRFDSPVLTELTSQFRMTAKFRAPPDFSVIMKPSSKPTPADTDSGGTGGGEGGGVFGGEGGGGGGENTQGVSGNNSDTGDLIGVTGAAMTNSSPATTSLLAVLVPQLLLLLLFCLLLLLCWRRRRGKPKTQKKQPEADEEYDSSSGSEDSED